MTMGIKTPALGRRTFLQVTGGGIAALALGSRDASAVLRAASGPDATRGALHRVTGQDRES